jgi:hypothetical protein
MQLTSNFAEGNAIVSGKVNEKYGLPHQRFWRTWRQNASSLPVAFLQRQAFAQQARKPLQFFGKIQR